MTNISNTGFKTVSPASGDSPNAGPVTFIWTADPGASVYSLCIDKLPCIAVSGLSATANVNNKAVTHKWYVKSDQGGITLVTPFTVQ